MSDNIIAAAAQRMKEHQQATQRLKWFIAMYEELSATNQSGSKKRALITNKSKRSTNTSVFR